MKTLKNSLLVVFVLVAGLVNSQKKNKLKTAVLAETEALLPVTNDISIKLWEYSETALKEHKSAAYLIDLLKKEGFEIKENIAGMPTAFTATYGSGSPKLGILAEYDALPGTGNQPVPRRSPREDGVTNGQGCGHNLFGSASVTAAIALRRTMEKQNIQGTLVLYGTPAEETVVGKVYMAREGVFDGLDAVIEWHPGTETGSSYTSTLAMNNFEVEFFGQAAHGAMDPWNGRSALDAVEMMNFGVNLMREHVHPTTRIHYVIPNAGEAPNVVPEYAKVWYYVRDTSRADVEMYYDRILKIAEGAAMGTNTTHKVRLLTGVHQYNLNGPLMLAMQKNIELIGPPSYTAEEQSWAKELQAYTEKEAKGFSETVREIPSNWRSLSPSGGSTDVAEVSFITPTAGFSVATAPLGVPWHSWATSASHGTAAGRKGAAIAAKVLAATGIDILTNADLREEAKKEFLRKTGGRPYQSPLPEGQQVVLPGG